MSEIDEAALRAIGEKATPGPWRYRGYDIIQVVDRGLTPKGRKRDDQGDTIVDGGMDYFDLEDRDGTYIAAFNPLVCLQLLDELSALRSQTQKMDAAIQKVCKWLDRCAVDAEKHADQSPNFPAFAESCRADAKNYRATAADLRKVLGSR